MICEFISVVDAISFVYLDDADHLFFMVYLVEYPHKTHPDAE